MREPNDTPRDDEDLARAALRRFSRLNLSEPELDAERDHLEFLVALMGTYPPSEIRDNGIAYYQHELDEATRLARRVTVANLAHKRRVTPHQPDFVRARYVDCVDLIQTLTGRPARKQGANWVILCPFHNEDTPSLVIYPPGGGWHCFGCGRGGDAVAFVAAHKECSMVEALRLVEELCNVA